MGRAFIVVTAGGGLGAEAGQVAGYDVRLVPVGGSWASQPDGLLEVGADGREGKKVFWWEVGKNLAASDGCGSDEFG